MITVEETGPLSLVQDLGRPGWAHLGVSPSGAADRAGLRLANRLVGNSDSAAAIECTLGGLTVVSDSLHWVAVAGAPTEVVVNEAPTSSHSSIALRPGDRLQIRPPADGVRSYLAVRGGIKAERVLGSRATDVLAGLGPPPLTPGQILRIGRPRHRLPDIGLAPPPTPLRTLPVLPGPRLDWFDLSCWPVLLRTGWRVSADANRVAVRLEGPSLTRSRPGELPSEGLVRGAVQVPTSGQPLIFSADHPVTGGYPVVAVLTEAGADAAAQLRPGEVVRFTRAREAGV